VAQELLGKILVREWGGKILTGIITETEAYGGRGDPASHAYTKKTARNQAMFGPVGHSYIYFIYGNHYCFNIVARSYGVLAGAVLIRALAPIDGITSMKQLRGIDTIANLTNGPGKIGQALCLDRSLNHIDMTRQGLLYVKNGISVAASDIEITSRIGIKKAQDKPWRFVLKKKGRE